MGVQPTSHSESEFFEQKLFKVEEESEIVMAQNVRTSVNISFIFGQNKKVFFGEKFIQILQNLTTLENFHFSFITRAIACYKRK